MNFKSENWTLPMKEDQVTAAQSDCRVWSLEIYFAFLSEYNGGIVVNRSGHGCMIE